MKIVVAVTAASGALYARLCLEQLLRAEEVSEIALVYSTHASEVADFEGVTMPEDPRIRIFYKPLPPYRIPFCRLISSALTRSALNCSFVL